MGNIKNKKNPFLCFISGGLSGIIEICITYPLEYTKTRLQVFQKGQTKTSQTFFRLYSGFPVWLLFSFPRSACRYGTFHYMVDGPVKANMFLAGLTAGFVESILCLTPMQNISVKLTHDSLLPKCQRRFNSFFSSLYMIFKEHGIRKVCTNAMFPTTLKTVINQTIRFSLFHSLEKYTSREGAGGVIHHMLFGAIAGGISATASHPVDVVRANMMSLHGHTYRNSLHCLHTIIASCGFRGLYAGIMPRVTRVCIEVALSFTLFEWIYQRIKLKLNEN